MSERVMQQEDHVGRLVRTLPTGFRKKCCGPNCVFLAKYTAPKWSSVFGDGAPDPGIETAALASPALASGFFTTEPPGKPF